jgi:beta-ribofuranosylaminobenzene 5'-phosphate synthase
MSGNFSQTLNGDKDVTKQVTVETTARLHMGFFDLNGDLGRRFGSIGLSLDKPCTRICATINTHTLSVIGADAARAEKVARTILSALNLPEHLQLNIVEAIPAHSGLGSGTQMALAIGMAINALYDLHLTVEDIAKLTSRGARSGIGLGTFATGGVIVDGGRGPNTVIPPVIAHLDFPEAWRVLLIFDNASKGVHGDEEIKAFRTLPKFSEESAARLCRHVLMQALPSLAEQDLQGFGLAIQQLQEVTGDYFAPVQGGRYASAKVTSVLNWFEAQGAVCYGQSSWGPTGFVVFADDSEAVQNLSNLNKKYSADSGLTFLLCKGRNQGGIVTVSPS